MTIPGPWEARTGWLDAAQRAADHRTGLAPYYPFLYACALGLKAQRVLEFGAGESSWVLFAAMRTTDGTLMSIAPHVPTGYVDEPNEGHRFACWQHLLTTSEAMWDRLKIWGPYDLVLHDGSHSADIVRQDLLAALPHVRRHGLILVHDPCHSYVGAAVQHGVREFCRDVGIVLETLVLPFAFGLCVMRVLVSALPAVDPTGLDKPTSEHRTVLLDGEL